MNMRKLELIDLLVLGISLLLGRAPVIWQLEALEKRIRALAA